MSLFESLRTLGVHRGDVVMAHASMRAVGERAEDLVSALLDALGPEGTLMAYVDFEPTPEVPYFDLDTSPAASDYGVLAEVIRRWPGAVRSANPGASMAAIGARAAWICADHPLHYGYGPGSPLAKLIEADGKVLLLGSHFNHVTLLHYAEHVADIPNKRVIRYEARAGGADLTIEEFDTSNGVVEAMNEEYFDEVVRAFLAEGGAAEGRVGNATCQLMSAPRLTAFAVARMERDFG